MEPSKATPEAPLVLNLIVGTPLAYRLEVWAFASKTVWALFALAVVGGGVLEILKMSVFPFVVLALVPLLLAGFLAAIYPGAPGEGMRK